MQKGQEPPENVAKKETFQLQCMPIFTCFLVLSKAVNINVVE